MVKIRTTICVPEDLHKIARARNINISQVVTEALELEIYGDNGGLLEKKVQKTKMEIEHSNNKLKSYEAQLSVHKEKKQVVKEKLDKFKSDVVFDYRSSKPKKE